MILSRQQADFLKMFHDLMTFTYRIIDNPSMKGLYLKVNQWNRTFAEQKKLFKEKRTKTLNSKHLKGLAVDLLFMKSGKPLYESPLYEIMGNYWEGIGGVWGGSWKFRDVFHFEYDLDRRKEWKKKLKNLA